MTRTFALIFTTSLALCLASTGCSRHVDDPGSHGDGIDDSSTDTSTDDCGAPPGQASNAIAISLGELEAAEPPVDGNSSGTGGGTSPDPSTIVIKASNQTTYTCDAPLASTDCSGPTTWEVSVELAPSQVAPGTFDLSDPAYNSFYSITGSDGGGDCWGGGGSFLQGQLVIDSVDATAIHFHLTGTNGNDDFDGVHPDGMYMATRCN
jgi:hypothetical protein